MNHQQQHGMNKIQKIPIDEINEEPTQYDGLYFDLFFFLKYLFDIGDKPVLMLRWLEKERTCYILDIIFVCVNGELERDEILANEKAQVL